MHPIFQWLDYQYEDYGGFAPPHRRALDRRLQEPLHRRRPTCTTATVDTKPVRQRPASREGRAAVELARQIREPRRLHRELVLLPAAASRSSPARSSCTRRATDRPVPGGRRPVGTQRSSTCGARRSACSGTSTAQWQVFANVSRSAEVPSFGENIASRSCDPFSDIKAQTRHHLSRSARAAARPDYTWDLAAYRAEDRQRAAVPVPFAFGNCQRRRNADKTIHQGLEIGFGVARR